MSSNFSTTVLPIRTLTPQEHQQIKKFFTPPSVSGFFLAAFLPIVLCLSLGSAFFSTPIGVMAGISIAAILVTLKQFRIKRSIKRAGFVYEYGDTETLTFNKISSNYGYKVNGAPQQVISLSRNGKPITIKTFNPNFVAVYSIPRQTAYTHPQYPSVIVPEGLFNLEWPQAKITGSFLMRRALVFVLPFAFIFGLTYFISGEMNSNSETHAQPDAIIYRMNAHLVLATVINSFKAYEVSNKGVYGNDYCYAEGIDLSTGKQLWKVKLDAQNSNGNNGGGARLLGQSATYLFFLRNQFFVISKATGKLVAKNNYFNNIASHMPEQPISGYEDDAGYTWNDSLNAIVVKGTDGLYYTISGATLQTGTTDIANADNFFKNRFKYGNNYEDQITDVYDDGHRCYTLLDVQDTVLLAHNSNGVEDRAAFSSVRRMLYSCASDTVSDGWTTLNSGVFLFGGFLADATIFFQQPQDSIAKYKSYQSLASRFSSTNAPMRTLDGGFLILHKTTIEPTATLLLTAVASNGNTKWEVSTGYGSIPLMYKDTVTNKLYLLGHASGGVSDDIDEILTIDLQSGATSKYKIKSS